MLTGLFRLHRRKWISDVTGTNTIFDVKVGNRKFGLLGGEDFSGNGPLQKEPHA